MEFDLSELPPIRRERAGQIFWIAGVSRADVAGKINEHVHGQAFEPDDERLTDVLCQKYADSIYEMYGELGERHDQFVEAVEMTAVAEILQELGIEITEPGSQPLRVLVHVRDSDNARQLEDDQHVFYDSLDGDMTGMEAIEGTSFEELSDAVRTGQLNPFVTHLFILDRPEPDAWKRLEAIRNYFKGE